MSAHGKGQDFGAAQPQPRLCWADEAHQIWVSSSPLLLTLRCWAYSHHKWVTSFLAKCLPRIIYWFNLLLALLSLCCFRGSWACQVHLDWMEKRYTAWLDWVEWCRRALRSWVREKWPVCLWWWLPLWKPTSACPYSPTTLHLPELNTQLWARRWCSCPHLLS